MGQQPTSVDPSAEGLRGKAPGAAGPPPPPPLAPQPPAWAGQPLSCAGYPPYRPGGPPPQQPYGPYQTQYAPPNAYPGTAAGYQPPPAGYPPPQPAGYPPQAGYPPPQHLPVRPQAHNKPPQGFNGYDEEAAQAAAHASAFAEQHIRKQFVRKVFCLVFMQLCVTVGIACVFIFVEPVKNYVKPGGEGQWVFWAVWAISLVVLISFSCSTTLRRKHPYNLITLFVFTLVQSVLVGVICSYWDASVVLMAFGVTCAAVGGLTLMAVFGKFDMTKRGHLLGMASSVIFMIVLVTMLFGFFYVSKWWYLAISCIVAVLFSVYLVYDIQTVMGGKRVAISPDEYVFASVQIYMDVILIFLSILSIFGIAQS